MREQILQELESNAGLMIVEEYTEEYEQIAQQLESEGLVKLQYYEDGRLAQISKVQQS